MGAHCTTKENIKDGKQTARKNTKTETSIEQKKQKVLDLKVTFYGGAGEVGRSCIVITTEKAKIMLDAGVKPGETNEFPEIPSHELKDIDAVLITHAHLDHCCFTPHLFARGYNGFIYTTKPTMELLNVQVSDYMRLSMPQEIKKEHLDKMSKRFKVIEYRQPFSIKDVKVEFINAGHLVGSCLIRLTHKGKSVLYTGDINLQETKLLEGADLNNLEAETLIMESTYGGKGDIFQSEKDMARSMVKSINDTLLQGGKVLIPSFGVGRAQEVLLFLDDFMNSGKLPKVPIYVDGMIGKVLRIHRHNVIYCRKEIQSRILMSDYDPFKSDNFKIVEKPDRQSITDGQACIIVTTSGMLTGGPVVFYLKRLARDPKNKLMLIGYQVEGTPGRELLDGHKEIDFHDSRLRVNMKVELYHMSAHADRRHLEMIPKRVKGIKRIFIVHGEARKSEELAHAFSHKYRVMLPKIGDSQEI